MKSFVAIALLTFYVFSVSSSPLTKRGFLWSGSSPELETAKKIKQCCVNHPDKPNSKQGLIERSECVMRLFSPDDEKARESFTEYLKNADKDVIKFFNTNGQEAKDFFNFARLHLLGLFPAMETAEKIKQCGVDHPDTPYSKEGARGRSQCVMRLFSNDDEKATTLFTTWLKNADKDEDVTNFFNNNGEDAKNFFDGARRKLLNYNVR